MNEAFPPWGDVKAARAIVSEWLDEDARGFVIPADEWGVSLFNSLCILLHETDPALVAEVRALRAKVEAVEALANEWRDGHEPVHHFGYIADIERALDGVEFPGQPRPTPEADW